jgi:hypothetical protein
MSEKVKAFGDFAQLDAEPIKILITRLSQEHDVIGAKQESASLEEEDKARQEADLHDVDIDAERSEVIEQGPCTCKGREWNQDPACLCGNTTNEIHCPIHCDVDRNPVSGDAPTLPEIKEYVAHDQTHGGIVYDGQGHRCQVLNCEVNRNPHNLNVIFEIIDRKEWL